MFLIKFALNVGCEMLQRVRVLAVDFAFHNSKNCQNCQDSGVQGQLIHFGFRRQSNLAPPAVNRVSRDEQKHVSGGGKESIIQLLTSSRFCPNVITSAPATILMHLMARPMVSSGTSLLSPLLPLYSAPPTISSRNEYPSRSMFNLGPVMSAYILPVAWPYLTPTNADLNVSCSSSLAPTTQKGIEKAVKSSGAPPVMALTVHMPIPGSALKPLLLLLLIIIILLLRLSGPAPP
eukprot:764620-Hanusia_phi.AAC.3